jgi:ABC-2 type transport system permease protein
MKNLLLIMKLDILESFKTKWFLIYTIVFGGTVALFLIAGVTESRVLGFSGLSRLLLSFIQICIVILPIFILITTVRSIAGDRDNSVLEYMLSFPVSLKQYYMGKFFGRLFVVIVPVFGALFFSLFYALVRGAEIDYFVFIFYIALLFSLSVNFLGISFFISSLVKSQEIALGIAFFVWLTLLAFIDIVLIGVMMRDMVHENIIFAVALLNPMQVFRIGAIALFDTELSVIGPASYFILDTFGKNIFLAYSLIYPITLGVLFLVVGYMIFRKKDLI